MREILFRGKRTENGEWIEGFYAKSGDKHFILIDSGFAFGYVKMKEVIPETVSEYTGLTDKNGKKIFDGDIMVFCKGATHPFEIKWDGLGWKMFTADGKRIKDSFESGEIQHMQKSEVIGNKWDNPELLEVEE